MNFKYKGYEVTVSKSKDPSRKLIIFDNGQDSNNDVITCNKDTLLSEVVNKINQRLKYLQ
jgi:hypothetical protein